MNDFHAFGQCALFKARAENQGLCCITRARVFLLQGQYPRSPRYSQGSYVSPLVCCFPSSSNSPNSLFVFFRGDVATVFMMHPCSLYIPLSATFLLIITYPLHDQTLSIHRRVLLPLRPSTVHSKLPFVFRSCFTSTSCFLAPVPST